MSRSGGQSSTPRAVIHKRILDVADSKPNASIAEIADSISGASTDLVERVLEEYGDPLESEGTESGVVGTEEEAATPDVSDPGTATDENAQADEQRPELSQKQLDTLRLIEQDPDASQGELAEALDVTRATVSRWLNDIPGFEWRRRGAIAADVLSENDSGTVAGQSGPVPDGGLDDLSERLDALERAVERLAARDRESEPLGVDPELAHKVVHASMGSDLITEDEELRLLRALMD